MEWIEEGLTGVRIFEKLQKQGLEAGYSGTKKELAKFIVDNLEISTLL